MMTDDDERWGRPYRHFAADFEVVADTGCDIAPACLRCPLERCKYDDPVAARAWHRGNRNTRLLAAFNAGVDIDDLTREFDISRRGLYRAVAQARREASIADPRHYERVMVRRGG